MSVSTVTTMVFGQYNDMHMLYSSYMVLFVLVDLQSQCMVQVCEPVNICLGNWKGALKVL